MKVLEAFKSYQRVVKDLILNITAKPTKWFVDFVIKLFNAVVAIPGKINFSSLSRYSGLTDRTFRNWFKRKDYNWLEFNRNAAKKGWTSLLIFRLLYETYWIYCQQKYIITYQLDN